MQTEHLIFRIHTNAACVIGYKITGQVRQIYKNNQNNKKTPLLIRDTFSSISTLKNAKIQSSTKSKHAVPATVLLHYAL